MSQHHPFTLARMNAAVLAKRHSHLLVSNLLICTNLSPTSSSTRASNNLRLKHISAIAIAHTRSLPVVHHTRPPPMLVPSAEALPNHVLQVPLERGRLLLPNLVLLLHAPPARRGEALPRQVPARLGCASEDAAGRRRHQPGQCRGSRPPPTGGRPECQVPRQLGCVGCLRLVHTCAPRDEGAAACRSSRCEGDWNPVVSSGGLAGVCTTCAHELVVPMEAMVCRWARVPVHTGASE
jgi:hypothetical protein